MLIQPRTSSLWMTTPRAIGPESSQLINRPTTSSLKTGWRVLQIRAWWSRPGMLPRAVYGRQPAPNTWLSSLLLSEKSGTTWTRTSWGGRCAKFQTGAVDVIQSREGYIHNWHQGHHWIWQYAFQSDRQMAILSVPEVILSCTKPFVMCVLFFSNVFCKLNSCNLVTISWLWIKRFLVRFCVQEDLNYLT